MTGRRSRNGVRLQLLRCTKTKYNVYYAYSSLSHPLLSYHCCIYVMQTHTRIPMLALYLYFSDRTFRRKWKAPSNKSCQGYPFLYWQIISPVNSDQHGLKPTEHLYTVFTAVLQLYMEETNRYYQQCLGTHDKDLMHHLT